MKQLILALLLLTLDHSWGLEIKEVSTLPQLDYFSGQGGAISMIPFGFLNDSILIWDQFAKPDAPYNLIFATHTVYQTNLSTQATHVLGQFSIAWGDPNEIDDSADTIVPPEQSQRLNDIIADDHQLFIETLKHSPLQFRKILAKIHPSKMFGKQGKLPFTQSGVSYQVRIKPPKTPEITEAMVVTSSRSTEQIVTRITGSLQGKLSACGYLAPEGDTPFRALILCENLGQENVGVQIFGVKIPF